MNKPFQTAGRRLAAALIVLCALCANAPSRAANILYVVNSVVDPVTPANANDQEVYAHLVALNHTVTLADDDTVPLSALTGQDLCLISSSVGSGAAGLQNICNNSLKTGRLPVISYEPGVYDELGLQTATTFGNAAGHTTIGVVTSSHPAAAGKTGVVQIVNDGTTATLSYTPAPPYTLGTDAIIIATNASVDIGRICTWVYERGTRLADNATITPGRKVALFFNASTGQGVWNENAYAFFDAALAWALEPPPVLPIVSTLKSPTLANALPNAPLVLQLEDGTFQVNQGSISLSLNGNPIASPSISKAGAITTISNQPAGLFASGSTNTLRLVFSDNATTPNKFTNTYTFVAATYATLPTLYAYSTSLADQTAPGFRARVTEANTFSGTLPNSSLRAEQQLAGTLIDPTTAAPYTNDANLANAGPDGFFIDPDVINWSQNSGGTAETGDFRAPNYPDEPIPGIPGTDGVNTDNVAAEVLTYLELQAGAYTFGVNSDDGFAVYAGTDARDAFHTLLGSFEGGRAAADTLFSFVAPTAGLYSFRVLWYEGNGDSSLEFFSVNPSTGEKILINDRTNANSIKAWRQLTTGARPYISSLSPTINATGVGVTNALSFTFVNGTASVNTNAVQILLNGTNVPIISVSTASNTVTVVADPAGDLKNFTTYNVRVVYADTGSPVRTLTNDFAFTTIRKPIQEGTDGMAVVEAEQYSMNTPQGDHQWVFVQTPAGYSGTGDMYAFPDAPGATINYPASLTTSPRLDFEINFTQTGTYYLWWRGSDGGGNSINAGVDGDDQTGLLGNLDNNCCGTRVVPTGASWVWVGPVVASGKGTFEITEAGVHTINVWMREDGQLIDKLLVTTNASFVPSGLGPDQSPRLGQSAPTISITSPANNATIAPGNITITVNPADSDGSIKKVEFFEGANKLGESTVSPFTFVWTNAPAGIYNLTARATDNDDLSTTSAAIKLTVGIPPPQVAYIRSAAGSTGDTALVNRLKARGYQVTEIVDTASVIGDINGKALLVISSSVGSGNVIKFANAAIPTVIWETAAYDDFGFDANNTAGATVAGQTQIQIVDPTHPLAAGMSGTVTVYTGVRDMSALGAPVASVKVVATLTDGTARPVIFAVDTGATLFNGSANTARRAGFFASNDTFGLATPEAFTLFDAAVDWVQNIQAQPKLTATLSNGQIVISWTGGGALEYTGALVPNAVWTPVAGTANPYSENVNTTTMRFFRVKK